MPRRKRDESLQPNHSTGLMICQVNSEITVDLFTTFRPLSTKPSEIPILLMTISNIAQLFRGILLTSLLYIRFRALIKEMKICPT